MRFPITFCVFLLTLPIEIACERPSHEMATIGRRDTLKRQSSQPRRDTVQMRKDTSGFGPTYEEVKKEFERRYTDTLRVDSTYFVDRDTVQLHFSHYCNGNIIVIPAKYNWGPKKTEYVAYGFVSEIALVRGGKVIFHRMITKARFDPLLDESLMAFGVLLFPNVSFDEARRVFSFDYSISIPLTDVGTAVVLEIGLDGKEKIGGG
jgi:hypothetical protein